MSVPLATLRRNALLIWLYDSLGLHVAVPGTAAKAAAALTTATQFDARQGKRLAFSRADDAEAFLRFWRQDVDSLMALRRALQKSEPSTPVYSWSDDEVLRRLAACMARGAVVALQSLEASSPAVMPAAPAVAAVVNPPAVPVSQILSAIAAPEVPLLPLLEEVQIEGADVLPEIEQSLEQVDITIGQIKLQPVSLAPTPSKVPAITTAMTDVSASVTATLDSL
ncbi:MAG: hypothetical protein HYX47_03385 [Burkholderiales bacterium]|nr:hypothetical protein [Burkholderiales bacterium]